MTKHSTSVNNYNHPKGTDSYQADQSKLVFLVLGRMNEVARVTNWYNLRGEVVSVANNSCLYLNALQPKSIHTGMYCMQCSSWWKKCLYMARVLACVQFCTSASFTNCHITHIMHQYIWGKVLGFGVQKGPKLLYLSKLVRVH